VTKPAAIHTCVLADDDANVRRFITRVLSAVKFRVSAAQDGDEAIALLTAQPCDVLVTDLAMPGGEGLDTIMKVRKQFPSVKILAISGVFDDEMLVTAQHLGASASLAKPFTKEALVAAVLALVDPTKP
jgi:DNA-binding response OmpR family regulator